MLTKDPKERITAEKALKHPWFGLITEIKLFSTVKKEQQVSFKTMKKLKNFQQGSELKRCSLELLMNMLSTEEKQAYEKEFNKFDANKNGVITDKDFINKIKESESEMPHKEIKKIAKELDYDDKAQINYSNFITATLDVKKLLTKQRLETIFKKFAGDSKYISPDDLQRTLDTYGFNLTLTE
jgi:calcium-dependent protein kinase